MNYFFIALITTSVAAFIIYFLLNRFLHTRIQAIPLMLCAVCSLFLSMALPKFIVRYTDWIGTLAVLALFSLLFAYFLAYYDEKAAEKLMELEDSGESLLHTAQLTIPDEVAAALPPIELKPINDEPGSDTSSCLSGAETSLQIEVPAEIPCIDEEPAIIETAGDMLDRAFKLKELRDYNAAAQLFQNVLQLNGDSSAAPLLIFEIADSLCHSGEFHAAKQILIDGLRYPAVTGTLGEHKILAMISSLEQRQESEQHGGSESEEES